MNCCHIYWRVEPTEREVTVNRRIGRGKKKRIIEDTITEVVPGRSFWIADEAYRYCRANGIPVHRAKMSFGYTATLSS